MSDKWRAEGEAVFVISAGHPLLGMEIVARDLLRALHESAAVELVIGAGQTWVGEPFRQRSLGTDLKGWRRVFLVPRFWKWSRSNRHGVVVVAGVWAAIPWLLAAPRQRCVIWEHSLSREKIQTSRGLRVLSRIVPPLYRRAWRVVCVSTALADDLTDLTGREDIVVIPNVVETEGSRPSAPVDAEWPPRRLLCVGSLTNTKRQATAIEAMTSLDEASTLTIAGDGPESQRLADLVSRLGVEHRVQFLGHVSRERVLDLMAESDVLVHPAAGETFGMVLIEAAQLGLPVIAVDTPHSQEFVPRYVPGAVFDGTAEGLAQQLTAAETPVSPGQRVSAASARAEYLTTSAIVSRWLELIDSASMKSSS